MNAKKKTSLADVSLKRPAPQNIDAWINNSTSTEGEAAEPCKKLTIELPADLHSRVKGKCGTDGLKIKEVVNNLLREWVET